MSAIRVDVPEPTGLHASQPHKYWCDPVENALGVLTGQDVAIDHDEGGCIATIGQGAWVVVVELPAEANDFLARRWESHYPGDAFAFDLEVPDWIVAVVARAADLDELVPTPEVARLLGIKTATLKTAANQLRQGAVGEHRLAGRLRLRRLGRDWVAPRRAVEAEIARRAEARA